LASKIHCLFNLRNKINETKQLSFLFLSSYVHGENFAPPSTSPNLA
jgi:hypothetical protein